MELTRIAEVQSSLTDAAVAPKQGDEGAPDAWLVFSPDLLPALEGIEPADREVLRVHPRDDPANPMRGVFATRSADRPNPLGLHEVDVLAIEGDRMHVRPLEALHGTPVVDVKPVL